MSRKSFFAPCALLLISALPITASATTTYHVVFRPMGTAGLTCKLAFDLTHVDPVVVNRAELLSFVHDGLADSATVDGGPGYGDLVDGMNPAAQTTLESQFFANSLIVPIHSLGTSLTFRLDLTEQAAPDTTFPDEFAMFFLRTSNGLPYPTTDDLGTDALFVVDITGQPGGELSVFSPMRFVAPDSLILDAHVLSAPIVNGPAGRLRFRSSAPNPSSAGVRFTYEVPEPGGVLRIRVFDLAGRQVAQPFAGNRSAGVWTTPWNGRDSKARALAPGAYIVQLQMDGQSLVTRIILTR